MPPYCCAPQGQRLRGPYRGETRWITGALDKPVTDPRVSRQPCRRHEIQTPVDSLIGGCQIQIQASEMSHNATRCCHRQSGLARHVWRFHEVPPQLLHPPRGRRRRAPHWPSFICCPSANNTTTGGADTSHEARVLRRLRDMSSVWKMRDNLYMERLFTRQPIARSGPAKDRDRPLLDFPSAQMVSHPCSLTCPAAFAIAQSRSCIFEPMDTT